MVLHCKRIEHGEGWSNIIVQPIRAYCCAQDEKRVLDVKFAARQEKAVVWLYAPNGTDAQLVKDWT